MKRILFLIAAAASIAAHAAALQPIPRAEWEAAAASLRVDRLLGRFEEERSIPGFPKAMRSSGRFELKDGVLIWEILEPFPSKTTLSAEGIAFEDRGASTTLKAGAEAASLLTGVLSGDLSRLERAFSLALSRTERGRLLIDARPKSEAMSRILSRLVIEADKAVERVQIESPAGETTRIRFLDVRGSRGS